MEETNEELTGIPVPVENLNLLSIAEIIRVTVGKEYLELLQESDFERPMDFDLD